MSNTKIRAIETRIDSTFFDRCYWASPRWREATRWKLNAVSRSKDDVPKDRVEITPAEAATCGGIWEHRRFCDDWSLLPMLLSACVERHWTLSIYPTSWSDEEWIIELEFSCDGGHDVVEGKGATLPEALCRAIIAVLDAIEEEA